MFFSLTKPHNFCSSFFSKSQFWILVYVNSCIFFQVQRFPTENLQKFQSNIGDQKLRKKILLFHLKIVLLVWSWRLSRMKKLNTKFSFSLKISNEVRNFKKINLYILYKTNFCHVLWQRIDGMYEAYTCHLFLCLVLKWSG